MTVIDALSTPAARQINRKIYEIKKEYSKRRQQEHERAKTHLHNEKRRGGKHTRGKHRGAIAAWEESGGLEDWKRGK